MKIDRNRKAKKKGKEKNECLLRGSAGWDQRKWRTKLDGLRYDKRGIWKITKIE